MKKMIPALLAVLLFLPAQALGPLTGCALGAAPAFDRQTEDLAIASIQCCHELGAAKKSPTFTDPQGFWLTLSLYASRALYRLGDPIVENGGRSYMLRQDAEIGELAYALFPDFQGSYPTQGVYGYHDAEAQSCGLTCGNHYLLPAGEAQTTSGADGSIWATYQMSIVGSGPTPDLIYSVHFVPAGAGRLYPWSVAEVMRGTPEQSPVSSGMQGPGEPWQIFREDGTWSQACQACLEKGGQLAGIGSQEEWEQLVALLGQMPGARDMVFLIGARRDLDSRDYHSIDGQNLLTGPALNAPESWAFTHWGPYEPSWQYGGSEEHVLCIRSVDGSWCLQDVADDLLSQFPELSGRIAYVMEGEKRCRKKWP